MITEAVHSRQRPRERGYTLACPTARRDIACAQLANLEKKVRFLRSQQGKPISSNICHKGNMYGRRGYVPKRGLRSKKPANWRGARRLRRIMTWIRRKKQGFGRETKTRETDISYNPVARFYIVSSNICHAKAYRYGDISVREEKESYRNTHSS